MNPPEENFENLRKLLELKRHETPPPGYFEGFSSNLIARIEAEDARPAPAGWRRFFPSLDTSPLMVGAYGVIVASLVIAGVLWRMPDSNDMWVRLSSQMRFNRPPRRMR